MLGDVAQKFSKLMCATSAEKVSMETLDIFYFDIPEVVRSVILIWDWNINLMDLMFYIVAKV